MADKNVSTLNDLIEISRDGEAGFRKAAEDAHSPDLKTLFASRAAEIGAAVMELQTEVAALGGKPEDSGSVSGTLRRGWMSLREAVSSRDDKVILEETEKGEDIAKQRYAEALQEAELAPNVRTLIERQYQGVLRNHGLIRDMRNRYRAA